MSQCDRCHSPLDPLRTVLQIVEGLRDGRRYRLMLCEACAVGFARWMAEAGSSDRAHGVTR